MQLRRVGNYFIDFIIIITKTNNYYRRYCSLFKSSTFKLQTSTENYLLQNCIHSDQFSQLEKKNKTQTIIAISFPILLQLQLIVLKQWVVAKSEEIPINHPGPLAVEHWLETRMNFQCFAINKLITVCF